MSSVLLRNTQNLSVAHGLSSSSDLRMLEPMDEHLWYITFIIRSLSWVTTQ